MSLVRLGRPNSLPRRYTPEAVTLGKRIGLLAAILLVACGETGGSDIGVVDSSIRDGQPHEIGPSDALPDAEVSLDAGSRDVDVHDAGFIDIGVGSSCEEAIPWPQIDVALVETTTDSVHLDRFECAGIGAGALAPERWFETRFDSPANVIIRLGTAGWDSVMSVRTSTCAVLGEVACVDAPTIVELPAAFGTVFVGVDGFTDGQGPFVLSGAVGPALTVPPIESSCEASPVVALPVSRIGHNFGVDDSVGLDDCPLMAPVFMPVDLVAAVDLSIRAEPRAGQDLSLAVLSECGAVLACAAGGGPGHAETLTALAVGPGRATIAIGSPPGARAGSFTILAVAGAGCAADADCPLGERCNGDLSCGPLAPENAVAAGGEIPDNGILELLLPISAAARPRTVRLRLAMEHEFPRDLVVTLSAPGGLPRVRLRDRLDGFLDSVYGKDRPADGPGSMVDFGLVTTASGTWTLEVEDRAPGDVGRVTGAVLEVE